MLSSIIGNLKIPFLLLRQNKKVVFIFLISTLFFGFVLLPINDLGRLASSKLSELTKGQVSIQFDNFGFSLLPLGIKFTGLSLETEHFPTFKSDQVILSPNILGLLTFNLGASIQAKGFMGGALTISTEGAGKTPEGDKKQAVKVSAKKLNLSLSKIYSMPLEGEAYLKANVTLDTKFKEQPKGDVTVYIEKFVLPSASISSPMGPLTLPYLNLSKISMTGKLKDGQLQIYKTQIGDPQGELYGNIKGSLAIKFIRRGRSFIPVPGSYSFNVDLTVKDSLSKRARLFLSFVDQYKSRTQSGTGQRYALKISGVNFHAFPRINPLR